MRLKIPNEFLEDCATELPVAQNGSKKEALRVHVETQREYWRCANKHNAGSAEIRKQLNSSNGIQ